MEALPSGLYTGWADGVVARPLLDDADTDRADKGPGLELARPLPPGGMAKRGGPVAAAGAGTGTGTGTGYQPGGRDAVNACTRAKIVSANGLRNARSSVNWCRKIWAKNKALSPS